MFTAALLLVPSCRFFLMKNDFRSVDTQVQFLRQNFCTIAGRSERQPATAYIPINYHAIYEGQQNRQREGTRAANALR